MWDPSWSLRPCGEYQSLSLFTWIEDLLCSERIYPFLHSCNEGNILLVSANNLYFDAPLFLNWGLLLENIGECIKALPCGLHRNDHQHEILLNKIKDDVFFLLFILLQFDFPLYGGRLLFHWGYITIKEIIFKNVQYSCIPCDEVGSTFEAVF